MTKPQQKYGCDKHDTTERTKWRSTYSPW